MALPVIVLAALCAPSIILDKNVTDVSINTGQILAAAVTALLVKKFKGLALPLLAGMLTLWAYKEISTYMALTHP